MAAIAPLLASGVLIVLGGGLGAIASPGAKADAEQREQSKYETIPGWPGTGQVCGGSVQGRPGEAGAHDDDG